MRHLPIYLLWWFSIAASLYPVSLFGFVRPDQVLVLVNKQIPESGELANYYMERRGIPVTNRVDLHVPFSDSISRHTFEEDVLQPVRAALVEQKLSQRIKVLVPVYGIPLRVQGPALTTQEEEWIADARGWIMAAMDLLREQEVQVREGSVHANSFSQTSAESIFPSAASLKDLTPVQIRRWKEQFLALLMANGKGAESQLDDQGQPTYRLSLEKIIRRVFGTLGTKAVLADKSSVITKHEQDEATIARILSGLMHDPSSTTRPRAYSVVQEAYGVWGILAFAQWEIDRYRQKESSASVDSELSFLWWKPGTYPLAGRLPNPFYLGYAGQISDWPLPLVMVSRIDAPIMTQAKKMIHQAVSTESNKLAGNVYVDARGMKKGPPLSYGFYDADMQDFANIFRDVGGFALTLENTEERFNKPGQAPNVALYVGWYRLRHYEDAFTFNPGAIGYHIASGEAVSIHNPKEPGWCKNALERGITVTLGPVGEPYLDAFPLPTEFFGLLYSGKYSLVEAYFLSKRYLSWKMVLFGDPLYRPWFKADSMQHKDARGLLKNRPYPISPTQAKFPALDAVGDFSKFPGKYAAFTVRVLSP